MATTKAGFGTAAPIDGTWSIGDRVYNTDAAIGQPEHWSCTAAGTPGTWIAVGVISPSRAVILETIADLRNLSPSVVHGAIVEGYYVANDSGGGAFHGHTGAAPGTYVDNGGTIIVPNGGDGSEAWERSGTFESGDFRWFGAKGDWNGTTGTDDTTAIVNTLAVYKQAVGYGKFYITSKITIPVGGKVILFGGLGNTTGSFPESYFVKAASMTTAAIDLSSRAVLSGGGLICVSGNTADGVNLIGNSAKAEYFYVYGAGNDGFRIGQDGVTGNYNACSLFNCTSQYNGRYGLYINDDKADPSTGANCNVATITQFFARGNGSDGIRLGFCYWTILINCLTDINTGYGLYLSSVDKNNYPANRWTTVVGGDYNEGNTAGAIFDESYFSTFIGLDYNSQPAASGSGLQGSGRRIWIGSNVVKVPTGVTFPATQAASSDVNTLDDYEEGTWTPAQAGVALTVNSATYTKIGRQVFYTFDITWPATADATAVNLTGFVHTPQGNSGAFNCGFTTYSNVPIGVTGTGGLPLYNKGGVPSTQLTNVDLTEKRIIGGGVYFAAT